MKRILKTAAFCLLAAVITFAAGCGSAEKKSGKIVVFADSQFGGAAQTLAETYDRGAQVEFVFDTTQTLSDKLSTGEKADLLVLYGVTPADKLRGSRLIDNYLVFAGEKTNKGSVALTMAKPLSSRSYAQAQRFADFILSDEGRAILKQYGYAVR
jgi:ABC-type molybdate transport system substrate-binding protein